MDIIRAKSSIAESYSSVNSYAFTTDPTINTTASFTSASHRNNTRHSYTAAEFNKFKSRLLKNHSRNYYAYDNINLNSELLRNNGESKDENQKTLLGQTFVQHGYSLPNDNVDIAHKNKPEKQLSQIKSIYETIQRANNSRVFSLEMRRSNYLNNLKNTNNALTNSLMIQKMTQRT